MAIYLTIDPNGVRKVVIQANTKLEEAADMLAWIDIQDLVDDLDRTLIRHARENLELLERAQGEEAVDEESS